MQSNFGGSWVRTKIEEAMKATKENLSRSGDGAQRLNHHQ